MLSLLGLADSSYQTYTHYSGTGLLGDLCSPWAWRSRWPAIRRVRLAAVAIGICFVLYLIYAELIEIGRICPYCTSVHILNVPALLPDRVPVRGPESGA